MASIMAVLAIISLVAGGLLGTFRHRAYGVWSLAGILIAIVTANVAGTSIGIWMASSIGTTEASPVLVLVKTSVLVVVSLIISYYASDLLPVQHDPKTRLDNIMAGTLGVFNAYLIIATILVYVQGLNNEFSINLFGDGQSFNFNRMFVDGLPWLTSVLVLYIVGWSSIRKFKQAWAKLRGTSSVTPPASTGSATTGANYYPSQTGGFNPSYPTPSSSATATPPENQEKKSWLSGISGWFRREEKPSESDMNNPNASMSGQAPMSSNYSTSTYQGTSGATPPYGIATSSAVASSTYNAGYNTTSNTGSGYSGSSAGYVAPSYNTGYTAAPASTSGYSSTTSYTPPASTSGYSSTTSYTPTTPASPSYPSSYSGTSTTPPSNYQSPSTPPNYSPYNPGVSSGFNPANPPSPAPSTPDAAVGGLVAGGVFGATFANSSMSSGFDGMNAYQDADEDDEDSFGDENDEDNYDGYSSGYRG
jgi:hypothetical protein